MTKAADLRRAIRDLEDDLATALGALEGAGSQAVEELEETYSDIVTKDIAQRQNHKRRSVQNRSLFTVRSTYAVPGEIEAAHRRFAQDLALASARVGALSRPWRHRGRSDDPLCPAGPSLHPRLRS